MSLLASPSLSSSSSTTPPPASVSSLPSPLSSLFVEFMSRTESEQFLQQTLAKIHSLDATVAQHQIVRDSTSQQQALEAQQLTQHEQQIVHMEDANIAMPASATPFISLQAAPSSGGPRSPTFINITPPSGPGSSPSSATSSPRSPLAGTRSPGTNGRVLLSPNPHPLDPTHLQGDVTCG